MKTFKQSGEVLPVIAPYDVQRGSGVLIGQLFGLACATVNAGTSVDIMCKGEFVVDKVTTEAWAVGDKIYWNSSSKKFSNVGGGGLLVGLASESAVNPSLLGSLLLTQQPGLVDPVFNAVTGGSDLIIDGSRLELGKTQTRIRAATQSDAGTTLVDLSSGPTVSMGTIQAGSATWSLLTIGGRRKWGVKLTTPFGAGNENYADFTIPGRVFASTDIIDVEFYSPAGSYPRVYISNSGTTNALIWRSINPVGQLSYIRRTGSYRIRFPVGSMAVLGSGAITDTMAHIRVATQNTGSRGRDAYVVGKITVNRKEKSRLMITCDDGLTEANYLADQCAARGLSMTAYVIPSLIDTASFLTSSQLAQLAAKGNVQIANHSYSHTYANGGPTGSVWGSTVAGVCASQTVAVGALTINGTIGSSVFDKPRHITFVTSAMNSGVQVDIVGTLYGVAQTETVYLAEATGYPYPTVQAWTQITSVTISTPSPSVAAGTITVGTSCSYDELFYDIQRGFEYLESLGYSKISDRHYCSPQGQANETLFSVLTDLGVKTCRLTDVTLVDFSAEHDSYKLPAAAIEEALATNDLAYIDLAVNAASSLLLYLHQIKIDNSPPAAGGIKAATLSPILDKIAGYVAAGSATSQTVSENYKTTSSVF